MLKAEADLRLGGRFSVTFRTVDGKEHCAEGEYLEVVPGEKLVFTWRWTSTPERVSRVTLLLRAKDGGTELTLRHEGFADEAERDSHREGWSSAFDKLEAMFVERAG